MTTLASNKIDWSEQHDQFKAESDARGYDRMAEEEEARKREEAYEMLDHPKKHHDEFRYIVGDDFRNTVDVTPSNDSHTNSSAHGSHMAARTKRFVHEDLQCVRKCARRELDIREFKGCVMGCLEDEHDVYDKMKDRY